MPKVSIDKEKFIEEMNNKYGAYGEFDFSTLVFKASKTTVKCNKCGKENTKPALRHISCTCSSCYSNMSQRSNNEKFISTVETKFGKDKFKFDKLNYINAITKVTILCTDEEHNDYFEITPNKFLTGKGCPICNKNEAYSTEEFVEKVKENYGDSLDLTNTVYVNQKTKVTVYCKAGNHEWTVDPKTLLVGKTGCGTCSGKGGRSTERFIELVSPIHNHKYDYSLVEYTISENYVDIVCPTHGVFSQQPKAHMAGKGCPSCGEYGYQPSKPGYFYVQKLTNKDKTVYKYGITGDMKRRVNEQSRHSGFEHTVLIERYFEDGNQPLLLEKFIKKYIESGVVSTEELPSGFTETFDAKYLESVLEIVNTFK
ncbi:hypothetical protein [Escherichia phage BF17]|nr:hypothetical protein [Escherichia coli]QXN76324.1 hypothetical protein [Escherichia phage BF17]